MRLTTLLYPKRVVSHVFGGHVLKVQLSDPVSSSWYDSDWPRLAEFDLLAGSQLISGARVFDIGAHQGIVAMMLAAEVGTDGSVVAIEANSHNLRTLQENLGFNGISNVIPIWAAGSFEVGSIEFNKGFNGRVEDGSGSWGIETVPAVSIDHLAERYGTPDVLFVDVEGYECEVLRGAAETMNSTPDCFVEVHVEALPVFGHTTSDVLAFFDPDVYDLYAKTEDQAAFSPLNESRDAPAVRFFLVALAKV